MKKAFIGSVLLLWLGLGSLAACIIEISADNNRPKIGDQIPVSITLKYEHRRCVIELADTQLKPSGLEIIDKGEWQTLGSGTYSLKLKVRIKATQASLAVVRECEKKGISQETMRFKVM
ncbi:MAG: hypothetical protein MUF02_00780 [Acidobacteria bacterium]|jgi:hypothetical protein|nr:hypothetical protein [Acidobacteriota bacterium]